MWISQKIRIEHKACSVNIAYMCVWKNKRFKPIQLLFAIRLVSVSADTKHQISVLEVKKVDLFTSIHMLSFALTCCLLLLRCDFCSKPYTNYMSLRNHMRIHGQKRYMCDLCGKAFRLARYLRNHQRIHDDGPNRFDCPSCCKSYRTMLELAQHRCSAAASNQVRRWAAALRRAGGWATVLTSGLAENQLKTC